MRTIPRPRGTTSTAGVVAGVAVAVAVVGATLVSKTRESQLRLGAVKYAMAGANNNLLVLRRDRRRSRWWWWWWWWS